MYCPNCKSDKIHIQIAQTSSRSRRHSVGFLGHLNNFFRMLTAVCTLGLSNLFWKRSEGTEKRKYKNERICICQDCGYSWRA